MIKAIRLIGHLSQIIVKILLILLVICFFISPSLIQNAYSVGKHIDESQKIVAMVSREIEISPGSDYYIRFFPENLSLYEKKITPYSSNLSDRIKYAIAKSPCWIQRDLTRQFHAVNGDRYADLILNTNRRYVDEIAFSIACSSLGDVPPVDVVRDNVFSLYKNDKQLQYANIVDYDGEMGNYYSTIQYRVVENDTEKQLEYPRDVYYWNVVHPEVASEKAIYVYNRFWREYLFDHNDLGYPLLREKLADIRYLWDGESYFQPNHRLWKWSMRYHPTAVEAISYWIGKTVPMEAYGSRPGQPNVIAHEHNGWCGELQRIAVAALRTALIPTVGVCNYGEDHVWREFYERGWHQNDNWWSHTGGTVDKPYVYTDVWKKNMSSIFAWKGDDSIYDVTSRYMHPEDLVKIDFVVLDRHLQPADGARITVFVTGPRDITWLKNRIWGKIEKIWNSLPQWIKGKILQTLYTQLEKMYSRIPDTINSLIPSIWNYTDMNGRCSFELGRNRSYIFIIQQGNLKKPWRLAEHNTIRVLHKPKDATFHIVFPFLYHRIQKHDEKIMPNGKLLFNISFNTVSYQLQSSILTDDIGKYDRKGKVEFFVVDENNFRKYKNGERFTCYSYMIEQKKNLSINASENRWYLVFRNPGYHSRIILDLSVEVRTATNTCHVQIVSPETTIFDRPIFNVGDQITVTGVATNDILLYINNASYEIDVDHYRWKYKWNTTGLQPGDYTITAICGNAENHISVKLIDTIPPEIKIDTPKNMEILQKNEIIKISGHAYDNVGIKRVEVSLDDLGWREANGTSNWHIQWNTTNNITLGKHIISARVFDILNKTSTDSIYIVINESGHNWGPEINNFYHQPEQPTNISNIVIYANVTSSSPFNISKVILHWNNTIDVVVARNKTMYRYGDNPAQSRHEEDPLRNLSNNPVFGLELGELPSGSNITYWITAYDTANNIRISDRKSFTVKE
ncbi:MAG: hypothetical protein DRN05_02330 [Thermoplasmata archaeon]|nr:MAG: hypothetical protein DRN05_02330 [Thermoplasmata archaeon]